jgi:hypothetical protein
MLKGTPQLRKHPVYQKMVLVTKSFFYKNLDRPRVELSIYRQKTILILTSSENFRTTLGKTRRQLVVSRPTDKLCSLFAVVIS